uniref:Uncharacterized protein n=1 Tax=Anguilla anguilla TaxID=7936 RepID=A0A0E9R417_ANGAN
MEPGHGLYAAVCTPGLWLSMAFEYQMRKRIHTVSSDM